MNVWEKKYFQSMVEVTLVNIGKIDAVRIRAEIKTEDDRVMPTFEQLERLEELYVL